MAFEVSAEAYRKFMGRFSERLAVQFATFAGVSPGMRALDVGCGPGALTAELVRRLGAESVDAADPSEPFVAAMKESFPGVGAQLASAEELPFADAEYDVVLAQLVVQFIPNPASGLREMARVTRPGGVVAACVWDAAGGTGPLATFYEAAHEVVPDAVDESDRPGTGEGQLAELALQAGLHDIVSDRLVVVLRFETFADWWDPFTLGVGPPGDIVARLDAADVKRLRDRCERLLPPAPFEVSGCAWAVRARA